MDKLLPQLTGIEEDVAQAVHIRTRIIDQLSQATEFAVLVAERNERGDSAEDLHQLRRDITRALAEITEEDDAKWWLNARTKTPTDLLVQRCPELRAFMRVAA